MNTRIICFLSWMATASLVTGQSPSQSESPSWRQLISQESKTDAALEAAGDEAADAGRWADATAHYEAWRDRPEASAEQKALATIKLAQLAEAQFQVDSARASYLKALTLVSPKSSIAHEIRLRIEDSYCRQGDLPGLITVWQNHLKGQGDDPDAGLLLANALAELRRPEEGAPWPHRPTPVATGPAVSPDLAAALAARRTRTAKDQQAALQKAFDNTSDPLARLDIVAGLGIASLGTGQRPELIASFRAKARTEEDGWRYAVYLAEIQRSAGNNVGAREELARAFGPRSRDVLYLTEAWRLSHELNSTAERARLSRLLAELAPSTPSEIELVSALLQNKETAEALKGLQANADTLSTDPMAWHDALFLAGAGGLGPSTVPLLEAALARQPADWRLRFLLAETRLQIGDTAGADKLLREVEAAAPATPPASPPPVGDIPEIGHYHSVNGYTYDSGTAEGPALVFARRNTQSAGIRQLLQTMATGFDRGLSGLSPRLTSFPSPIRSGFETPLLTTPRDGADAALVIRSVLAQQQGKGAEFLAELQTSLTGFSRAERIARLTLVQALDPLLQELSAEAHAPAGDEMAQATGLEVLLCLCQQISPALGRVDVDAERLIPLLKAFLAREKHPAPLVLGKVELSRLLESEGQEKEAAQVAREALDQWASLPEAHHSEIFLFALERGDIDHAEAILAAMAEAAHKKGSPSAENGLVNYQIRLASVIGQQNANDPRLPNLLASMMRNSFALSTAIFVNQNTVRARSALQQAQKFPYGSRLLETRWWTWSMIYEAAARAGQAPALRAAMVRELSELPPERALLARLAGICFAWWSRDRDTAIHDAIELAKAQPGDDLSLLAGSMLAEAGRADDAQPWFERVSANDEQTAIDKAARLLSLARAKHDTEGARTFARQLAELPISSQDQMFLQNILGELDLKELAINLRTSHQAKDEAAYYTGVAGAMHRMQQEAQAGHQRAAADLAGGILALISPVENGQMERYYRSTALDTLRKFGLLADYTAELNRQLAADPKSTLTLLRLAESLGRSESAEAIALYRRAIQSSPDDLALQRLLARAQMNAGQQKEAQQTWAAILAHEPQAIFGDDFNWILNSYRSTHQLDALGALLVKTPPPSNPLQALVLFSRDTSNTYQQIATALQTDHKLPEAIQIWQASLAEVRANKASAYREPAILQALLSALLEAGRKEEAAQEIEHYFFPPAAPHPALGYDIRSSKRNWAETSYGMNGRADLQGAAIMKFAEAAGVLDRLRAKAAAARLRDPEHLLVLWVDVLRRNPSRLDALKQEFDEVLGDLLPGGNLSGQDRVEIASAAGMLAVQTPWTAATANALRAFADLLAEQPESRALALHILEKTPDIGAQEGWIRLHRAQVALSIPDQDAAIRALRKWIAWNEEAPSAQIFNDVAQQVTAAELLSKAGLTTEATTVFQSAQVSGSLQNRSDLKKRVDDLREQLTPSTTERKLK